MINKHVFRVLWKDRVNYIYDICMKMCFLPISDLNFSASRENKWKKLTENFFGWIKDHHKRH